MTFKESIHTCLWRKYARFSGRASRSEFWWFALFQMIALLSMLGIAAGVMWLTGDIDILINLMAPWLLMGSFDPIPTYMFGLMIPGGIVWLWLFIAQLAVGARRFQDRDIPGAWYVIYSIVGLVPFGDAWETLLVVPGLIVLVLTILRGTDAENRYGPDPTRLQQVADVFA